MIVKEFIIEDFNSYQYPSSTIIFPNNAADQPILDIPDKGIIETSIYNRKAKALVVKNLTPINDGYFEDVLELLRKLRVEYHKTDFMFILYTDYNKEDIQDKIYEMRAYVGPVIVKFGKHDPALPPKWDSVLGIPLSSSNQYAERIC